MAGGGIWLTRTIINLDRFAKKPMLHWPALTWLIASAVADITITASLCYYLVRRFIVLCTVHLYGRAFQARQKSGFSATDDTINKVSRPCFFVNITIVQLLKKIIRLTVQTGLITTLFAILDVVCFLVLPVNASSFLLVSIMLADPPF